MCHEKKYSIFTLFSLYIIFNRAHRVFLSQKKKVLLIFRSFFALLALCRELSYTPRRRRRRRRWEFTILIIIYFTWNHTFNARNQTRLNLSLCRKYKSFIRNEFIVALCTVETNPVAFPQHSVTRENFFFHSLSLFTSLIN